jgi:hypothetical protein
MGSFPTGETSPLRVEDIEPRPKRVIRAKGFADRIGLSKQKSVYSEDLVQLIRCIEQRNVLPARFYRKGKGIDADHALQTFGIMHLHLGGPSSNVLVYLFQFEEMVVLLEISNHYSFLTKPPGVLLYRLHWPAVLLQTRELAAKQADAARNLNLAIRQRLGLNKK